MYRSGVVFILLVMSGCASNIPQEIATAPDNSLSVTQALAEDNVVSAQRLRWGGSIASVENLQNETLIEVVAKDLQSGGRPKQTDQSRGRFLVKVSRFLDPEIYNKGRLLTVSGNYAGKQAGKIGEQSYNFPVVKADKVWLWAKLKEPKYYQRPYYYDPFYYDPFWNPAYRSRFLYRRCW